MGADVDWDFIMDKAEEIKELRFAFPQKVRTAVVNFLEEEGVNYAVQTVNYKGGELALFKVESLPSERRDFLWEKIS